MRILHTADWHLGKRLEHFSRLPEQRAVLDEICSIADNENVDLVVIAGDLFDTFNPSVEAIDLFYKTLKRLSNQGKRPVVAIAGNHDSPDRIEAPDPLAREYGILLLGYPGTEVKPFGNAHGIQVQKASPGIAEIIIPGLGHTVCLMWTPYANESRLRTYLGNDNPEEELRALLRNSWQKQAEKYCSSESVNILVAHLFMLRRGASVTEEPEDEKPILYVGGAQPVYSEDVPSKVQYVALGHLHRKQIVCTEHCHVVYSGSPIAYSMSEADQQKSVTIVDVEPGKPAVCRDIPLTRGKKLLRQRFNCVNSAIEWLRVNRDAIVEVTLVSDTFISNEDRQAIAGAHDCIVAIIPELTGALQAETVQQGHQIDLTKTREELFREYFRYRNAQDPNEEILSMFREVCSTEDSR